MKAIVRRVELGPQPRAEILFPRGDEDPDHLTAWLELPIEVKHAQGVLNAAATYLETMSIEQLADLKASARPIDRAAIATGR